MDTAAYRDASEATSEAMIRVKGLALALYSLIIDNSDLPDNGDGFEAVITVLMVLTEKADTASDLHQIEWDLIVHGGAA